jgi:hypothetical protein
MVDGSAVTVTVTPIHRVSMDAPFLKSAAYEWQRHMCRSRPVKWTCWSEKLKTRSSIPLKRMYWSERQRIRSWT